MATEDWADEFKTVWDRALKAWKEGRRSRDTMFSEEDAAFLAGIGCARQEMFDYVDDYARAGEPECETVLEVTAIRYRYFTDVMKGQASDLTVAESALPRKSDAVDGVAWLPRIIAKARHKLRGELPDELMYGCGGDRPFVRSVNMTLPQFLRLVWESGDDDRKIIDAVLESARQRTP